MSFPTPFFKWRPHPWHGVELGKNPPYVINAYIEITPFDFVKYEVEKITGYLRVDRPHRTSSQPPSLYGFIPKTYCGNRVKELSPNSKKGDGDPLDICIITERPINKSEIILEAKVVGGIQMIDHKEADDKIIAVLHNDNVWQGAENITDLPKVMIDRLRHYFLTYKLVPDEKPDVKIDKIYDREHALKVVEAAILDYKDEYGD
ncbi:MAG: inorganic pyrophosphatase [Ignavibacteriales bacterium]|jgi:inorganic pyrophosphatase|nr:inorganic pyrophosphatase [Ignavibacteriales bacterium]MBK7979713.1 inorganic pyrophosphatase [Ignavibacteriota bacterium]